MTIRYVPLLLLLCVASAFAADPETDPGSCPYSSEFARLVHPVMRAILSPWDADYDEEELAAFTDEARALVSDESAAWLFPLVAVEALRTATQLVNDEQQMSLNTLQAVEAVGTAVEQSRMLATAVETGQSLLAPDERERFREYRGITMFTAAKVMSEGLGFLDSATIDPEIVAAVSDKTLGYLDEALELTPELEEHSYYEIDMIRFHVNRWAGAGGE